MEHRIEKRIEIAAPVERVWQALTDFRQFGEWFGVRMEAPFVPGETIGGQVTYPGYEHVRMDIFIKAVEPVSYFAYTWHPYAIDPKVDYSHEEQTLVEFHLSPVSGGTLLVVTESGFEKIPRERYADAFRMNTRGWEEQMENIRDYIAAAS